MVHHGHPAVQRPRFLPMVAFVFLALVACDEGVAPPRPDSLELSLGITQMIVGETLVVSAIYRDDRGEPVQGEDITWSSSRDEVAQVSQEGLVTALGESRP